MFSDQAMNVDFYKKNIGHGLNSGGSIELVHKFVVQLKFVELETEFILAAELVLLIPSLNFDVAVGPKWCKMEKAGFSF